MQQYIRCSFIFVIAIDYKRINIKLLQWLGPNPSSLSMGGNMERVRWGNLAWLWAVRMEAHETWSLWGISSNKWRASWMRPHLPVPVYEGVGQRTTVLLASFDNLGIKVFGSKWGMGPHTKLELMEIVRDDKHSSPFWPKSIRSLRLTLVSQSGWSLYYVLQAMVNLKLICVGLTVSNPFTYVVQSWALLFLEPFCYEHGLQAHTSNPRRQSKEIWRKQMGSIWAFTNFNWWCLLSIPMEN